MKKIFKLLLIALLIPAWANAAGWDESEYKRIEQSIQLPDFAQAGKVYDITKYGAKLSNSAAQNQKAINKLIALVSKKGGGCVVITKGTWKTGAIEMKSRVKLEVQKDATLQFVFDTKLYPLVRTSWEGLACWNYSPCIYAYKATDIAITGEGTIDGGGNMETWWPMCGAKKFNFQEGITKEAQSLGSRAKLLKQAEDGVDFDQRKFGLGQGLRPQLINFVRSERILIQGVKLLNSPFWVIHPLLCKNITVKGVTIWNEGPNGDGCDPEACENVLIEDCIFHTGDDCIAIKSGKLGIEPELRPATHDVLISHCYMHDGHGAVVLGSEAAGGIKDLTVSKCLFERTDRGLRVKTRRGRGKDAVNEGITFEHIRMDKVLTPFVVNSFYFCDKDGKTDYVQNREALPVDDRTPGFGATTFRDIEATNCHAAAAYITGLPESKVTRLTFQDVHVTFAADAEPFVPAMACGVEPMVRQGIIAQNVKVLDLQNVSIEGQDGEELQLQNVDKVVRA